MVRRRIKKNYHNMLISSPVAIIYIQNLNSLTKKNRMYKIKIPRNICKFIEWWTNASLIFVVFTLKNKFAVIKTDKYILKNIFTLPKQYKFMNRK